MIVIAFLLALIQQPSTISPMRACLAAQTLRFEKSAERPEDIATAVESACRPIITSTIKETAKGRSYEAERALEGELRPRIREQIIEQVVEIRAGRKR